MRLSRHALAILFPAGAITSAAADNGTKEEIRIGQTLPYSGPASGFGTIGLTQEAYFEKINTEGGINGRKVKFITLDDAYSPPKTVEQTRKLIEQEDVLMMFGSLGTATNSAVHRYLNGKKVPQLFVLSGATGWADPKNYPWTMPGMAAYESEGVPLPLLLPGMTVSTGPDDYLPFQQLRLRRFNGKSWVGFGEILDDR
jgi:branched-chain amino acid transport system substrate-binding protein